MNDERPTTVGTEPLSIIQRALDDLELSRLDVVFVENVGNLVCPTHWALGEQLKLCILSAAEGHDKPIKYTISLLPAT